jgi:hypothetical protein
MWLLNTKTFRLECFIITSNPPKYAILSHTWAEREEHMFQALRDLDDGPSLPDELTSRAGWAKIEGTCRVAYEQGYNYVWIDSCCIDRSSSAELQESINSMFQWYEEAKTCFVYLQDVSGGEDPAGQDSQFRRSRWFKRGWTLQELLAPAHVHFLDMSWRSIGWKEDLLDILSDITGIESSYLT